MSADVKQAVWSGVFTVFGVDVHCHTLEDGTRIIEEQDLPRLLDAINDRDNALDVDGFQAFARWQRGYDS